MKIIDHDNVLGEEQRILLQVFAMAMGQEERFERTSVRFPNISTGHTATWCQGLDGEWAWFVEN